MTAKEKAPSTIRVKLKKKLPKPLTIGGVEKKGGEEVELTQNQSARLFEAGFLEQD